MVSFCRGKGLGLLVKAGLGLRDRVLGVKNALNLETVEFFGC